jgi:hypothetical protein
MDASCLVDINSQNVKTKLQNRGILNCKNLVSRKVPQEAVNPTQHHLRVPSTL